MRASYDYFDYEGTPCRIEADKGDHGHAQMYEPGTGFVDAPKMTILYQARPISKAAFEAMVIAITRASHTDA
jgi:hypothetical protein